MVELVDASPDQLVRQVLQHRRSSGVHKQELVIHRQPGGSVLFCCYWMFVNLGGSVLLWDVHQPRGECAVMGCSST